MKKTNYPENAVIFSHSQHYTKRRHGFNAAVEGSAMGPSTLYTLEKAFSLCQIFNLFRCVKPWCVEPFRNFKWMVCSLAYKGASCPVEY